jgi:two-component system, NarL family, nitrate/nitrite response regulator NarL
VVTAQEQVRVIVADDHPLYRLSAAETLERHGMAVLAACADGRATLAAIREHDPDVALVDHYMNHLDGLAVLEAVTRARLRTRVVVISGFFDDAGVYRAIELGAAGVLTKCVEHGVLVDAVLAVAGGATVVADDLHVRLAGAIRARSTTSAALQLTAREQAVLELMAEGLLAPEIARRLHVSPSTVKSHTHHLFEKLRVNERAAAVAAAMRLGLLD